MSEKKTPNIYLRLHLNKLSISRKGHPMWRRAGPDVAFSLIQFRIVERPYCNPTTAWGAHTPIQAQNELDQQLSRQRQTIQLSLAALRSLSRIILDDSIPNGELRARLFAEVPREELTACAEEIGEWVSGKRSDAFHGIVRHHGTLRKFSPAFLNALEFRSLRARYSSALIEENLPLPAYGASHPLCRRSLA